MEGLEDYLQYALLNLRFDDFNHLVDSALNTERKHLEMEDKKRKIVPVASGSIRKVMKSCRRFVSCSRRARPLISERMIRVPCGTRTGYVCQM